MRGAILRGKREVRVEEIPYPQIESGGIIVKVKVCGICGSDLHPYRLGERQGIVCGHEFSGDVAEVGAGVEGIKAGDRVAAIGFRSCGECYWCRQGMMHRCSKMTLLGEHFHGAMADYVLVPNAQLNRNVYKLPDSLSYEAAATIEPLAVGAFSVRRAKVQPENTVAVLGAGIIGLGIIQILKANGVAKIIASGRRASRLKAAKESGADLVIDAAVEDPVKAVMEATGGLGVDVVFDCAGSPDTFQQSLEMVHGGGKFIMVALYEQPITWDTYIAINKNITIIGILGGHFPTSLELLSSGKADTGPLISHQFPLDQAKEAFETQISSPDAVKVLITM